jgi:uncharacterized membrane protein
MGWNRWYAARSYVRTALWMVPLAALMLEQLTIRIVASIDDRVDRVLLIGATGEGTLGQMGTVVTLSVSFIVFTFGSMLAAIQVASGQLTPRIIATTLLRDNVIRATGSVCVHAVIRRRAETVAIYTDCSPAASRMHATATGYTLPGRRHSRV